MKRDPKNPELVLNNDLIGIEGAGELIGGSQREDDYETLQAAIELEGRPDQNISGISICAALAACLTAALD